MPGAVSAEADRVVKEFFRNGFAMIRMLVLVVILYAVILLAIAASAVGLGFLLRYLISDLELATAMLVGTGVSLGATYLFVKALQAFNQMSAELRDENTPVDFDDGDVVVIPAPFSRRKKRKSKRR